MNRLEGVITTLDYILDNRRKKHIMGGILMSASLLFAGLAFTIMTLKGEEDKQNEIYIE